MKGSDTADYVRARLERAAVRDSVKRDLLEQLRRGEITAHRAAVLAGYRRPRTALEELERWWSKASARERSAFRHAHLFETWVP